jgi:5'-3' exonuclease
MLIMPKKLLNLLPNGFEKIIDDNEEIAKFYPNTDNIRLDAAQGIKYIYSEAILPEIETDILMKSVKEVESKLKPTDKKRNVIRKKILII